MLSLEHVMREQFKYKPFFTEKKNVAAHGSSASPKMHLLTASVFLDKLQHLASPERNTSLDLLKKKKKKNVYKNWYSFLHLFLCFTLPATQTLQKQRNAFPNLRRYMQILFILETVQSNSSLFTASLHTTSPGHDGGGLLACPDLGQGPAGQHWPRIGSLLAYRSLRGW